MQRPAWRWKVVVLSLVYMVLLGRPVKAQQVEDEGFEISALRLENIVPGGNTLPVKMPALKPGTYEFVGKFHESTAKGRIIAA